MIKVLFVCPDNSFLSPAAKAMLVHIGGNEFVVESAGVVATPLNTLLPGAIKNMGIEISSHEPQLLEKMMIPEVASTFHYVIPLTRVTATENFSAFRYASKHIRFEFDDCFNTGNALSKQAEDISRCCQMLLEYIEDFVVEVLDKRLR